ncbi:MAG: hypothetical protein V3R84_07115 [Acidimicrobiia bacterium]
MRRIALLFVIALVAAACGDSAGGADSDRFCALVAQLEDSPNPAGMTPTEALEVIKETQRNLDELVRVAPTDIKGDVDTLAEISQKINELLIDAGGDDSQVDEAAMELIFNEVFTEEFGGAGDRVDDWTDSNCS